MLTIEYQCADGTPFPVEFDDEEQARKTWRHQREHERAPEVPLAQGLGKLAQQGMEDAYRELGLPVPTGSLPGPRAHGFTYADVAGFFNAEFLTGMREGCAALVREFGSALGLWHEYCMPRSKAAVAFLDSAGADVSTAELSARQAYGLHMTRPPAIIGGNDIALLAGSIANLYRDDPNLTAHELAQGYPSETLRANQELWHVGRLALADDGVMSALRGTNPTKAMAAWRSSGASPEFFAALDAFVSEFGGRSESWEIGAPTWNERRDGLWRQLLQLASPDVPEPDLELADGAARRNALVSEITVRLADDAEALGRFHRRLDRILPYVAIREERAHWQLRLTGAMRTAVLRRGDELVARRVIADREDVLYLVPEEVESGSNEDLRDLVAERRAEHERWLFVTPPLEIGAEHPREVARAALPPDGLLAGKAASRGVATGRARVILGLADADEFDIGDVLVCAMTAPPWTPLFGLASAVVVDSGDIASHTGIAAREYGIPCVLGTSTGTVTIPDGATVTVNGDKGTVEVH